MTSLKFLAKLPRHYNTDLGSEGNETKSEILDNILQDYRTLSRITDEISLPLLTSNYQLAKQDEMLFNGYWVDLVVAFAGDVYSCVSGILRTPIQTRQEVSQPSSKMSADYGRMVMDPRSPSCDVDRTPVVADCDVHRTWDFDHTGRHSPWRRMMVTLVLLKICFVKWAL